MLATTSRFADPSLSSALTSSAASAVVRTATMLFLALDGLHGLPETDIDLLQRAAAGLRFLRSSRTHSPAEHSLLRVALSELRETDAFVVEAAAWYASDRITAVDQGLWKRIGPLAQRRVLWFSAILRLTDAVGGRKVTCPDDVYAAWTCECLYIEFDGEPLSDAQITRGQTRLAALEAMAGRRVILARTATRRGAA
jgi:hypothetical protein